MSEEVRWWPERNAWVVGDVLLSPGVIAGPINDMRTATLHHFVEGFDSQHIFSEVVGIDEIDRLRWVVRNSEAYKAHHRLR